MYKISGFKPPFAYFMCYFHITQNLSDWPSNGTSRHLAHPGEMSGFKMLKTRTYITSLTRRAGYILKKSSPCKNSLCGGWAYHIEKHSDLSGRCTLPVKIILLSFFPDAQVRHLKPEFCHIIYSLFSAHVPTYPSDPGLEEVLSDEVDDEDPTEDVTEVTDSLLKVEDMMYGKTTEPDLLCFLSVSEEGWGRNIKRKVGNAHDREKMQKGSSFQDATTLGIPQGTYQHGYFLSGGPVVTAIKAWLYWK